MSEKYDIVIIGDTLPSAMFAYYFSKIGLRVQLFSHSGPLYSSDDEHFIVFDSTGRNNIFERQREKKLITFLKRNAAHLLISSHIEQYKMLDVFSRMILNVRNLITSEKIEVEKVNGSKKLFRLSYASYKISTKRLFVEFVKSIDNPTFSFCKYQYISDLNETRDKDYQLILENGQERKNVLTRSIFSSEIAIERFLNKANYSKKENIKVLYATYPAKELVLEKNIIFDDGHVHLKIIPWFEWVYFEFSHLNEIAPQIGQMMEILGKYFPWIQLDEKKIAYTGVNQQRVDGKRNRSENLAYFVKNQQHTVASRTLKEWLIDRHVVVRKVAGQLISSGINNLKIRENQLKGGEFDFPYHPIMLMEYADEKYDLAKQILKSPQYFKKLFYRYGSQIEEITSKAFDYWNQTKNIEQAWLMAEIWYAVNYEFCTSALEFIHQSTEEWMAGNTIDIEFIQNAFDLILKEG